MNENNIHEIIKPLGFSLSCTKERNHKLDFLSAILLGISNQLSKITRGYLDNEFRSTYERDSLEGNIKIKRLVSRASMHLLLVRVRNRNDLFGSGRPVCGATCACYVRAPAYMYVTNCTCTSAAAHVRQQPHMCVSRCTCVMTDVHGFLGKCFSLISTEFYSFSFM